MNWHKLCFLLSSGIAAECLAVGCPPALCWGGIQPRVSHAGNAQQTVRTGGGWFPGGSSSTVGICARSSRWPVCSKSSARESQQLASLVSQLSVLRVLVFLLTHALIGSVTILECVLAFEQWRAGRLMGSEAALQMFEPYTTNDGIFAHKQAAWL